MTMHKNGEWKQVKSNKSKNFFVHFNSMYPLSGHMYLSPWKLSLSFMFPILTCICQFLYATMNPIYCNLKTSYQIWVGQKVLVKGDQIVADHGQDQEYQVSHASHVPIIFVCRLTKDPSNIEFLSNIEFQRIFLVRCVEWPPKSTQKMSCLPKNRAFR